jgi:hypothetical protein
LSRHSPKAAAAKAEGQARDVLAAAVRFAFRTHQFAGGFDPECRRTFELVKTRLGEVAAQVAARDDEADDDDEEEDSR